MAGRPRSSECMRIDSILKEELKFFDTLPLPGDLFWRNLSTQYDFRISVKNLYTRGLTIFKQKANLKTSESSLSDSPVNPTTSSETSQSYRTSEDIYSQDNLYFKFTLTPQEVDSIKPEDQVYSLRSYSKFKAGVWTHIIADKVYSVSKLQCAFKFRQHFISRTTTCTYYIRIKAKCIECNSTLICFVKNTDRVLLEDGLEVSCIFKRGKDIKHRRKRHVRGLRRTTLARELRERNVSGTAWRKKMSQSDVLFTKESANLPKSGTLRQIKYEENLKRRIDNDPVTALGILSQRSPFNRMIHEIGLLKFFIHYWTVEQVRVYNELCRKTNLVKISADATGGIVKKLPRFEGSSGYIMLYCLVVHIPDEKEGQIPVGQMLSERHHTNAIQYWLSEWIRLGAKPPSEFVCDYSAALINAACRAFTAASNKTNYVDICYEALLRKRRVPKCFLRIDVAHFLKSIVNWKELRSVHKRIKQFYIRSVGQLVLCTDIQEAQELILHIIVVALSETEGSHDGQPTPCETNKKRLLNKFSFGIQASSLENIVTLEDAEKVSEEIIDPEHTEEMSNFRQYIDSLFLDGKKMVGNDQGDRDNIMFLPCILDPLKRICYE